MDHVRGRAVARPLARSQDAGFAAAEGMLLLADAAPAAVAALIRGRVRSWVNEDPTGRIFATGTVARTGLIVALTNSAVAASRAVRRRDRLQRDGPVHRAQCRSCDRDLGVESHDRLVRMQHTGEHPRLPLRQRHDVRVRRGYDPLRRRVLADCRSLSASRYDRGAAPSPDRIGGTSGKGRPPGEWTGGSTVVSDSPDAATVFAQDLHAPHDHAGTAERSEGATCMPARPGSLRTASS